MKIVRRFSASGPSSVVVGGNARLVIGTMTSRSDTLLERGFLGRGSAFDLIVILLAL